MKAGSWLPKPSLTDVSNQKGLDVLAPFHLCQHHSTFVIKSHLHNQQASQQLLNDGRCPDKVPGQCTKNEVRCHSEAEIEAGGNELWAAPAPLPLPLPDRGFKSDQCSASTSSSVWSRSDRYGGSRHSCHGWQPHRESGGHVKINLPVFKDEDTKDAVTYQSWCWDLTVYHHAGCQDCTLLPYAIHSLHGYPGELVRVKGHTSPWMMYSPYWMSIITMSRPLILWIRRSFSCTWVKKRQYQTGGVPGETPAGSQHHSWNIFLWTMKLIWSETIFTVDSLSSSKQW